MKALIYIILVVTFVYQQVLAQAYEPSKNNLAYDSLLAKRLGADEYGMKNYVIAFLKAGPVKIQDSIKRIELQRMHLKNIMRLAAEGSLIIAGPFLDDQPLRGIFIFNVESVEKAKVLAETDPAVQAGTLVLELHPWYGSAALMEVPEIHSTIEKKSVAGD